MRPSVPLYSSDWSCTQGFFYVFDLQSLCCLALRSVDERYCPGRRLRQLAHWRYEKRFGPDKTHHHPHYLVYSKLMRMDPYLLLHHWLYCASGFRYLLLRFPAWILFRALLTT